MSAITPLRDFIADMTRLVSLGPNEDNLLAEGKTLLERLIADDAWLPDAYAEPGPDSYRQNRPDHTGP